jgi:DnaK suppressor protein
MAAKKKDAGKKGAAKKAPAKKPMKKIVSKKPEPAKAPKKAAKPEKVPPQSTKTKSVKVSPTVVTAAKPAAKPVVKGPMKPALPPVKIVAPIVATAKSATVKGGVGEEPPLTKSELAEFKKTLLEERGKITSKLDQHLSEAVKDQVGQPDEADQAESATSQAFLLRLADKERKLLRQIEDALRKIETGDFGYCEGTGDFIGRQRLKLRPWTRYSVEYKEILERKEGKFFR